MGKRQAARTIDSLKWLVFNSQSVCLNVSRWRELCGMREARKNHGLVVVNNRIYAIGGQGTVGRKHFSTPCLDYQSISNLKTGWFVCSLNSQNWHESQCSQLGPPLGGSYKWDLDRFEETGSVKDTDLEACVPLPKVGCFKHCVGACIITPETLERWSKHRIVWCHYIRCDIVRRMRVCILASLDSNTTNKWCLEYFWSQTTK